MKTNALLVLLFALIFAGCEKDDNSSGGGTPPPNSNAAACSATVNGTPRTASTVVANLHVDNSQGSRTFSLAAILGTDTVYCGFNDTLFTTPLNVVSYDGPDIYSSTLFCYSAGSFFNIEVASHFDISSVDLGNHKVSGHFSGTAASSSTSDTIFISNGVFNNVLYTTQ